MFVTNLLSSPLLPGLAYNRAPRLHTHSFTHSGPLTLGLGRLARMLAGPLAVQSPIPSSVVPVRASLLPVLLTMPLPREPACPQAGASENFCFKASQSSQVANDYGEEDHFTST
jgi:hypothetical protein